MLCSAVASDEVESERATEEEELGFVEFEMTSARGHLQAVLRKRASGSDTGTGVGNVRSPTKGHNPPPLTPPTM